MKKTNLLIFIFVCLFLFSIFFNYNRNTITANAILDIVNDDYIFFNSYLEASNSNTNNAQYVKIIDLEYKYDIDGTALITADGRTWSPLGKYISPKHFGASSDINIDSSKKIQDAINYVKNSWNKNKKEFDLILDFKGEVFRTEKSLDFTNIHQPGTVYSKDANKKQNYGII